MTQVVVGEKLKTGLEESTGHSASALTYGQKNKARIHGPY